MIFFFFVLAAVLVYQLVASPRDRAFTGIVAAFCFIGGIVYFVLTKQIVL